MSVELWLKNRLLTWAMAEAYQIKSATTDANGAIITAQIVWPDGATGTFTTDVASTNFPGAIDAYHVTYAGPGVFQTVTLPLVTRNTLGSVVSQPDYVIS